VHVLYDYSKVILLTDTTGYPCHVSCSDTEPLQVQVTPVFLIMGKPYAGFIQLIVYRNLEDKLTLTEATNLGGLP